jgi:hypothetical protein
VPWPATLAKVSKLVGLLPRCTSKAALFFSLAVAHLSKTLLFCRMASKAVSSTGSGPSLPIRTSSMKMAVLSLAASVIRTWIRVILAPNANLTVEYPLLPVNRRFWPFPITSVGEVMVVREGVVVFMGALVVASPLAS